MNSFDRLNIIIISIFLVFVSCKQNPSDQVANSPLEQLNRSIQKEPKNPNLYVQRSEYYSEHQQFESAIQDLVQAIRLDSLDSRYYQLLSDRYLDLGDGFNARITLERVLRLFPDDVPSILQLAKLQLILKDYSAATRNLQRAKALDPFSAYVEYLRGMLFLDQEKIAAAKKAFQAAVELDDQKTDAWIALGEIGSISDDPQTIFYYDNALRLDPNNILALHSKAYYIQQLDSLDLAIDLYSRVYDIDSSYTPSIFNKGILLLDQNKLNAAEKQFRLLTKIDPQMIIAHYYLGISLEKQNRLKEALIAYQQTLRIDSEYFRGQEAVKDLTRILRTQNK